MTGPDFPAFSSARAGWTIQLADHEGGWQTPARLLADPAPCDCCKSLSALGELPSGAVLPQHALPNHPMRVLSRGESPGIPACEGDEESANSAPDIRGGRPLTEGEEDEYRRSQLDDDVNENQGDTH